MLIQKIAVRQSGQRVQCGHAFECALCLEAAIIFRLGTPDLSTVAPKLVDQNESQQLQDDDAAGKLPTQLGDRPVGRFQRFLQDHGGMTAVGEGDRDPVQLGAGTGRITAELAEYEPVVGSQVQAHRVTVEAAPRCDLFPCLLVLAGTQRGCQDVLDIACLRHQLFLRAIEPGVFLIEKDQRRDQDGDQAHHAPGGRQAAQMAGLSARHPAHPAGRLVVLSLSATCAEGRSHGPTLGRDRWRRGAEP